VRIGGWRVGEIVGVEVEKRRQRTLLTWARGEFDGRFE
jgi:hypothetical protein